MFSWLKGIAQRLNLNLTKLMLMKLNIEFRNPFTWLVFIMVSPELVTPMIRQIKGQIKSTMPADANVSFITNGMRVVFTCSTIKKNIVTTLKPKNIGNLTPTKEESVKKSVLKLKNSTKCSISEHKKWDKGYNKQTY